MDFQIKLFRWLDEANKLIMIGCGQLDTEGFEQLIPAADQRLCRTLKKYFEQISHDSAQEKGLVASVRKTVTELMSDGNPKLAQVAKKLAMGPRTLQRRLKEYEVDFKKLVEETRYRLAVSYLRDSRNTLMEIAFLLGYSEVSAFNRAFKRWTGSTPLDYRRMLARRVRRLEG
jgi:AraC-like DNA-binding protein